MFFLSFYYQEHDKIEMNKNKKGCMIKLDLG